MKNTLFILSLLFPSLLVAQADAIMKLLQKKLPDGTVIETRETGRHFAGEYTVYLEQPIDHNNPATGTFQQRIFLSHYDRKAPTLIVTEGYGARPRDYELADILRSNQIIVEYRFNAKSTPEKIDWKYMTNDQAMEDLHQVRKLFGKIYKKSWVSTGISKGGTTALIYKSKYPDDVDVAVSYVGPLPVAREDLRIDELILDKLKEQPCAASLDKVQRFALSNDEIFVPMIDSLAKADQITFDRVTTAQALEYAVLELTFSFLQLGYSCDEVPTEMHVDTVFNYIKNAVGFDFYSEETIAGLEPAFYQFMTENGYYSFIHEPFEGLLDDLESYDNSIFAPRGVNLEFDKDYLQRVRNYLHTEGDKIIYIQGGNDPWAACRFVPPTERDAVYIEKDGANHRLRIKSLDQNQKEEIYEALGRWLKVKIYPLAED